MGDGTHKSHSQEVLLAPASHARTTGPTRRAGRAGAFVFKPTNGRQRRAGRAGWAWPMTCRLSALTDRRTHTHSATRAPPCPTRAARASAGRIVPRLRSALISASASGPARPSARRRPGNPDAGTATEVFLQEKSPHSASSCQDEASASRATPRMTTMAAAAVVRAPWQEARAPCLKTVLSGL